ncbi:MAG: MFS transporter [Aurantimicrobium sp.]
MKATTAWFWAIFTLFFTRGLLFATWSTRGPEIRDALNLDLQAMGWYAACLSVGSVTGVLISERIVEKIGSRRYSILSYVILGGALVLLGLNLAWENTPMSFLVTALLGLPLGMADYDNNLEASNINRESAKNRVPMLHGGYSVGVLLGSALVGVAITAGLGITPDFISIGLIVIALSVLVSFAIGKNNGKVDRSHMASSEIAKISFKAIAKESRSRQIGLIGFAFVFAEGVGVVWIPIALVQQGFSPALAAFSYTLFGLGFVIMRFVGGPIADKIGRRKVVLFSAITATAGIVIFMATPLLSIPLVGALLWGLGDSIGLAMCVAAMGDDPLRVSARMSFLWTLVYLANLAVGPIIGSLSSIGGLLAAFLAPIILLVAAGVLSKSVSETHPDAVQETVAT